MKKLTLLALLIFAFISFSGFTPYNKVLEKESYKENKFIDSINFYNNYDYKSAFYTLENHELVDSFTYTTKKDCIDNTLSKYREILISEANNYIKNNDYTSASNLLNSKKKYYSEDSTITSLQNINKTKYKKANQAEYTGLIEHLTFDTLMAFPEKALSPNNNYSAIYDETKLTITEFQNILNELYKNNYVLINIYDIIDKQTKEKKPLFLPKNKKPIVLSFNNVTYKSNYQNLGEIDKIIVDRNNNIATYTTKKSIQDRVQYDNEFVVILENFIKDHPDFSHNNAKGIIFLSGENGILGYNTNHKNASSKYEAKRVSEVIHKLKNLGWIFGSHNYTYTDENVKTDIEFAKDLSLWNKEIKPIIGECELYAYPLGIEINNNTKKELLIANGFNIFFSNGNESKLEIYGDLYYVTRRVINGKNLRENSNSFEHLFSCEKVYDHNNRTISFYIQN